MPLPSNGVLVRAATVALLAVAAALPGACRFTFERELGPGELRGQAWADRVSGGAVKRLPAGGSRARIVGSPYAVRADSSGRFVFRRIGVGQHILSIVYDPDADGVAQGRLGMRVELPEAKAAGVGGDGRDLGTLLLGTAGAVQGTVRWQDSTPVEHAVLEVLDANGSPIAGTPGARSDADGRYRLDEVPAGRIMVRATVDILLDGTHRARTALSSPVAVPAGLMGTADLVLEPPIDAAPGSVSGRATAPDGIDRLTIMLMRPGVPPVVAEDLPASGFTIRDVPAGVWVLTASATGYVDASIPRLVVNGDTDVGTIFFVAAALEEAVPDCNGDGVPACPGAEPAEGCDADDDSDGVTDGLESPECLCRPGMWVVARSGGVVACDFEPLACRSDDDCTVNPGETRCHPQKSICVGCLGADDCGPQEWCTARYRCHAPGCDSSLDCGGLGMGGVCDHLRRICVQCQTDRDCPDGHVCLFSRCAQG